MWKLIANKHIQVAIDPQGTMPSIAFAVIGNEKGYGFQGLVFVPQNFLAIVADNPAMLIGGFAFTASQCRDYSSGKVPAKSEQKHREVLQRAFAFEAEALNTLNKIAQETGTDFKLATFQLTTLKQFPKGLGSLDEGVNYPTKDYRKVDYLPKNVNLN